MIELPYSLITGRAPLSVGMERELAIGDNLD